MPDSLKPNRRLRIRMSGGVRGRGLGAPSYSIAQIFFRATAGWRCIVDLLVKISSLVFVLSFFCRNIVGVVKLVTWGGEELKRCIGIVYVVLVFCCFVGTVEGQGLDIRVENDQTRTALPGDVLDIHTGELGVFSLLDEELRLVVVEEGVARIELGDFSAHVLVPGLTKSPFLHLTDLATPSDLTSFSKRVYLYDGFVTPAEYGEQGGVLGSQSDTAVLLSGPGSYYVWVEGLERRVDEGGYVFALIEPVGTHRDNMRFYVMQEIPVLVTDIPNFAWSVEENQFVFQNPEPMVIQKGDLVYIPLMQTRSSRTWYEQEGDAFQVVLTIGEMEMSDESVLLRAVKSGEGTLVTFYDHFLEPLVEQRHEFVIVE